MTLRARNESTIDFTTCIINCALDRNVANVYDNRMVKICDR